MSNYLNKNIWIIGSGPMSIEYTKVLKDIDIEFNIIGRGIDSSQAFKNITGIKPYVGGLRKFLKKNPAKCSHAIIAAPVVELSEIASDLIKYGIKNILIEKPGGLNFDEINKVYNLSLEYNSNVFIAYNRRFYQSVQKAKEIIKIDGGVLSFDFEFTEWPSIVEKRIKSKIVKENWFLINSTHVIDLAFYLGGFPNEISTNSIGGLSWHPSASIFSGSGKSIEGALFSYKANWEGPGSWSLNLITKNNKLIFKPLEKLQIQKNGTNNQAFVETDYTLDDKYKPGIFLQIDSFLNNKNKICTLLEHLKNMEVYLKIINVKTNTI